jgi:hypothetical protein
MVAATQGASRFADCIHNEFVNIRFRYCYLNGRAVVAQLQKSIGNRSAYGKAPTNSLRPPSPQAISFGAEHSQLSEACSE